MERELARLQRREHQLRAALESARVARRGAQRLALLAEVGVASPCSARWADMAGDDRVRFCDHCGKNVFDLSAMTEDEAKALLAANGERPCVRFHRRADGTILTADCPVGRQMKGVRRVAAGVLAAGAAAMAAAASASPGVTYVAHDEIREASAKHVARPRDVRGPVHEEAPCAAPPEPQIHVGGGAVLR